jgi:hypothetical protein
MFLMKKEKLLGMNLSLFLKKKPEKFLMQVIWSREPYIQMLLKVFLFMALLLR